MNPWLENGALKDFIDGSGGYCGEEGVCRVCAGMNGTDGRRSGNRSSDLTLNDFRQYSIIRHSIQIDWPGFA